ncbi:hypothetical protein FS837_002006 [Tulasnella sp. UAMH 9824]|nr:hypothetical protein FS837_002006 [Tulasnella sp. UAMH 9824]
MPPVQAHPLNTSNQGGLGGLPSLHQSGKDIQGLHMTSGPFGSAFEPASLCSDDQVAVPFYGSMSSNEPAGSFSPEESTFNLATDQGLLTPQDALQIQNVLFTPQSMSISADPSPGQFYFILPNRTASRTCPGTGDVSNLDVSDAPAPHVSDQPEAQDLEDVDGEPLETFDDARTSATISSSRNSPMPKDAAKATAFPTQAINTRVHTTIPPDTSSDYKPLSILQEYSRKSGFCPKCAAGNCDGVKDTRACMNPCFVCRKAECNGYDCGT